MPYVALYRKFRPTTFDDVKGQDAVVRILRNQVKTGRVQHAYLFCGTRGTGKTSVARILARAVNCEHPVDGNPCGECASCREIAGGTSMNVIEFDAASHTGVDYIRDINEEVQYRPTMGNYKIYIIDEVHMLSAGAFNAMLKTLEEPPPYIIFILATTEFAKIPVTILSRCQRYDFRRIDTSVISGRLRELADKEGVAAEDRALSFIARAGDGSMRDAVSLLDRCIAFCMDGDLTYGRALKALGEADHDVFRNLAGAVLAGDAATALKTVGKQFQEGAEIGQFVGDFIRYLRDVMLLASASREEAAELIDAPEEQIGEMQELAGRAGVEPVLRCIRELSELQGRMRYATNRRVLAEVAILQMTKPQGDPADDALRARLLQVENRLEELEAGGAVYGQPAARPAAAPQPEAEEELDILPEAAPEELKAVCADWKRLIGGMEDGFVKNRLRESAIPQYNAETLENRLYIELAGGSGETADRLLVNTPEYREEIEDYLGGKLGRRVQVELHMADQRPNGIRSVDVDAMMERGLEGIHMEVEEADEEEGDSPLGF